MALGTEVGLSSAQRRCVGWGCMDEDATWYGRRPQPRPHYVRRGPSSPLQKGRPMSIVTTVAHLSYCWALVQTVTQKCSAASV